MQTDWREKHGERYEGRKVVVTGGAGFIGSHLSRALVELGASVTAVDDLSNGDWANLGEAGVRVECLSGSVLDHRLVERAVDGADCVFHEAAMGSVPASVEQPRLYHEVNVMGTAALIDAARSAGVRRIVYAASSSAYGNPDDGGAAKTEALVPDPLSPYAASKLSAEHALRAAAQCYPLDTVALRYFNIFGPRQDPSSAYAAVIAAFAKALATGEQARIYGDGEQTRDFTYVDNVVHANLLAGACEDRLDGVVCNIACGRRVSINELHQRMAELLGRDGEKPAHASERVGDVKHSLASIERARRVLGYEPLVDFEDGLAVTVEWYRELFIS